MGNYFGDAPPHGVVVGDDGSKNAADAVYYARDEARRRGCDLHVVATFSIASAPRPEGVGMGVALSVEELGAEVDRRLHARWSGLAAEGTEITFHAIHGPAVKVLVQAAQTADVVVVGARGRGGLEGLLLGSVADQVLRLARCPVIRVRVD